VLQSTSLARTIDAANEELFFGRCIGEPGMRRVVDWLLPRQVPSGRWAGAFTPSAQDLQRGVRVFTGERLRTKWGTWNVLTAEAARLLILVGGEDARVRKAVHQAEAWLRHTCFASRHCAAGECAHAMVSYARLEIVAEALACTPRDSVGFLYTLSQRRDGTGRWTRFPFYYALLTLLESRSEAARSELRYALPACERVRRRTAGDKAYVTRRHEVIERVFRAVYPPLG
jgi:hypothetical protein